MSKRKNSPNRKNHKKVRTVPEFEGKVFMSRDGFAFVRIEGQEEDVYVKASKTREPCTETLYVLPLRRRRPARPSAAAGKSSPSCKGATVRSWACCTS